MGELQGVIGILFAYWIVIQLCKLLNKESWTLIMVWLTPIILGAIGYSVWHLN